MLKLSFEKEEYKIPPQFQSYIERHKLFNLFQRLLELLTILRPVDTLQFLYEELKAPGIHDVVRVFVIGPPILCRTKIATGICDYFFAVRITEASLCEHLGFRSPRRPLTNQELGDMLPAMLREPECRRYGYVLEGIPQNKQQALALAYHGIFPTNVIFLDIPFGTEVVYNVTACSEKEAKLVINQAMQDYRKEIYGLAHFYEKFPAEFIDITLSEETVLQRVLDVVRANPLNIAEPFTPRVVILGPPGSGKSLQADFLVSMFNLLDFDFEELVKHEIRRDTDLGLELRTLVDENAKISVPTELSVEVVERRARQGDATARGWVLHSFPDTEDQARLLHSRLECFAPNRVVFLEVSEEVCLERLVHRRFEPRSGTIYNLKTSPPPLSVGRKPKLFRLPQDSEFCVKQRLAAYRENQPALFSFYSELALQVDADRSPELVYGQVLQAVRHHLPRRPPSPPSNLQQPAHSFFPLSQPSSHYPTALIPNPALYHQQEHAYPFPPLRHFYHHPEDEEETNVRPSFGTFLESIPEEDEDEAR